MLGAGRCQRGVSSGGRRFFGRGMERLLHQPDVGSRETCQEICNRIPKCAAVAIGLVYSALFRVEGAVCRGHAYSYCSESWLGGGPRGYTLTFRRANSVTLLPQRLAGSLSGRLFGR